MQIKISWILIGQVKIDQNFNIVWLSERGKAPKIFAFDNKENEIFSTVGTVLFNKKLARMHSSYFFW